MDYKKILVPYFSAKIQELGLQKSEDEIYKFFENPKDSKMGDIAFPCFPLARELKKAPPMIANEIASALQNQTELKKDFSQIQAAGPYINFVINKANLAADLIPKILNKSFTAKRASTGVRSMIEYSQPNTHKGFHVGHTRNVALGDSLVRIIEWSGDDVVAANYIGDVGTHIAKCLWQYTKYTKNPNSPEFAVIKKDNLNKGEFLGQFYVLADRALDFSALSQCPIPHISCAKVIETSVHPKNPKWNVLKIETNNAGTTETKTVVSAAKAVPVNTLLAFAKPGARLAGRLVSEVDKEGVLSQGMLCSGLELGLNEDNENLHILDSNTPVGKELADIYANSSIKYLRNGEVLISGLVEEKAYIHYQEANLYKSISELILGRNKEVSDCLKALEKGSGPLYDLWQETRQWSLQDFNDVYNWLEARFDHFFYESEVSDSGKSIVKEFLDKGVFVKSEGAVGADLSAHKLGFFMVLKSDGTGLYSTKDLSLAQLKFEKFKIDRSVYVVDAAQSMHFQQVFKTLELMGYQQAKKSYHLSYGQVMLPDGKMSSRKGNVIPFSELKNILLEKIVRDFLASYKDLWTAAEIENTARRIAIATIKYGMLNQDNNKNIIFDMNEWTARSGNTGPYMMYAYTRTRSILRELQSRIGNIDYSKADWNLLSHNTEQEVIGKLQEFPNVVARAAEFYSPQQLCIYLYDLSKDFSRMYDQCSVVHAESESLKISRAALVDACGIVIEAGLNLLGIKTVEKM